jgi:hypothetical protein
VEIIVLEHPDRDVIARGSYYGGPDYEFVAWKDGQVYFRVVDEPGDPKRWWAGPDPDTFRRIASVWDQYESEVRRLRSESAQLKAVARMRENITLLGALPETLSRGSESLWALLIFEAENGLG